MKTAIFLKTQYGVTVELRKSGARWLDRYATEWQMLPSGAWESTAHNKVTAQEIGRWTSDSHDVYAAVKLASSNDSGFRNWGAVVLCALLAALVGCGGSGPIGPDPATQARALNIEWVDALGMAGYPLPIVTWYAPGDTGCGTPLPGTSFADGNCVGGQISIAGDHRETEINIEWTGDLATSPLCWALVSLYDGIKSGALIGLDGSDPRIASCRTSLQGAL